MKSLILHNVSKTFGGLAALQNVSFTVAPQSIFGIIGPNGAGKTTLFNLITGVYSHDEGGSIRLDTTPLSSLAPAQVAAAGVARTFQNIRLFEKLTVLENTLVPWEIRRRSHLFSAIFRTPRFYDDEHEAKQRALHLLAAFGLAAMAERTSHNLSYGDQRRLEIVRAMMLSPSVLLLDEPAAGMNGHEATKLNEQIRWLRDEFHVSVVVVEHNMNVIMEVCERIHVLDHGETITEGPPDHVRNHPHVLAAYLGEDPANVPHA